MKLNFQFRRDFLPLLLIGSLSIGLPHALAEDNNPSKGVGPIKTLTLEDLNESLAKEGKTVFTQKCGSCHKLDERYAGPALKGVTQRRTPEWIMNMILNPLEMTQKDEVAKGLLEEYLAQMSFQDVSEKQARSILEYFRYYDTKGDIKEELKKSKQKSKK